MKTYKHVYLIGVDGAGCFFTQADTPNIDKIFANGGYNHHVLTSKPTISAECWGSMLHGVTAANHNLNNSIVSICPLPDDFQFPSVFKVIREAHKDVKLASFSNWNPINFGIIENGLDVTEDTAEDEELTEKICAYLKENTPEFLFVQFDSVDGAGHHYGYGTEGHLSQISTVDGLIGKIYDTLAKTNGLEDALFLVTADHGGTPGGSHGGDTDAEKYVSFFVAGDGVNKGNFGEMAIRDTSAVVVRALGLDCPRIWTAKIPDNMFIGQINEERPTDIYEIPPKSYKNHIHTATPTGEKSIENFIDMNTVLAYFPFDGDLTDKSGHCTASFEGKIYYPEGFYGSAVKTDDCVINFSGLELGTRSCSFAAFIKKPKSPEKSKWTVVATTGDYEENDPGVCIRTHVREAEFRIGTGDKHAILWWPMAHDHPGNFWHIIFTIDRENNKWSLWYDFKEIVTCNIDIEIPKDTFFPDEKCHIGSHAPLTIDDVIVFDHALTPDEINKFKNYYGEQ